MNRRTLFQALIGSAAATTVAASPLAVDMPEVIVKWAICHPKWGEEPTLSDVMLGRKDDRKDCSLLFDSRREAASYILSFMQPALWRHICVRRFELTEDALKEAWRPEYHDRITCIFETTNTKAALTNGSRTYQRA